MDGQRVVPFYVVTFFSTPMVSVTQLCLCIFLSRLITDITAVHVTAMTRTDGRVLRRFVDLSLLMYSEAPSNSD